MSKQEESSGWILNTLDCGDNSCLYRNRAKPSGMRTNGGCRCFKELSTKKRIYVEKLFHEVKTLSAQLAKLHEEIAILYSYIGD